MTRDLLDRADWECCATQPGDATTPQTLAELTVEWWPARVPGTVAGSLVEPYPFGARMTRPEIEPDDFDYWYRCRFPGSPGRWSLELDGLATIAEVWVNHKLVLGSENMFVSHVVDIEELEPENELCIRFAALTPLLALRRPRPRFKSMMVKHQSLRWFRTTFLGRQPGWTTTPAPVGPWRPVRLRQSSVLRVAKRRIVSSVLAGGRGMLEVDLRLEGLPRSEEGPVLEASLKVGDTRGSVVVSAVDAGIGISGAVEVDDVELWWPHTHGAARLYEVTLEIDGRRLELGKVGFRTLRLDRDGGRFELSVNDVPVFCRGACWWPPDPRSMVSSDDDLRDSLELVREANMNMLRIPGATVYEDARFWDLCDELGIMVWQDCMLGYTDPPEDGAFEQAVVSELDEVLGGLGGRPALALVCGAQEVEEQAAFFGLPRERRSFPLIDRTIPAMVEQLLPGVPYLSSSPTGGELAFQPDSGDCHYWGVGSLLRDPSDVRLSRIRFMSEGMAFATPPERETVDEVFGGPMAAGHDPAWKRAVHHDTGRPFDLEDVRDHYVQAMFHVDPRMLRYEDPARALDLGRAVVAELMGNALSTWRSPGSTCAGGLLVALRDLAPGAGWGLVDALGRPKAPWFALKRVLAPLAVLVDDEGLNGLHLHVVNDTASSFEGVLRLELFARGELLIEQAETPVMVAARQAATIEAEALIDGFRDINYAYRYGPPAYDAVAVFLDDVNGRSVSEAVFLPAGLDRPIEEDIGLELACHDENGPSGATVLEVRTRRLAQWVVVEVPGHVPEDSWFHLAPGRSRKLSLRKLRGTAGEAPVRGEVRALNCRSSATLTLKRP